MRDIRKLKVQRQHLVVKRVDPRSLSRLKRYISALVDPEVEGLNWGDVKFRKPDGTEVKVAAVNAYVATLKQLVPDRVPEPANAAEGQTQAPDIPLITYLLKYHPEYGQTFLQIAYDSLTIGCKCKADVDVLLDLIYFAVPQADQEQLAPGAPLGSQSYQSPARPKRKSSEEIPSPPLVPHNTPQGWRPSVAEAKVVHARLECVLKDLFDRYNVRLFTRWHLLAKSKKAFATQKAAIEASASRKTGATPSAWGGHASLFQSRSHLRLKLDDALAAGDLSAAPLDDDMSIQDRRTDEELLPLALAQPPATPSDRSGVVRTPDSVKSAKRTPFQAAKSSMASRDRDGDLDDIVRPPGAFFPNREEDDDVHTLALYRPPGKVVASRAREAALDNRIGGLGSPSIEGVSAPKDGSLSGVDQTELAVDVLFEVNRIGFMLQDIQSRCDKLERAFDQAKTELGARIEGQLTVKKILKKMVIAALSTLIKKVTASEELEGAMKSAAEGLSSLFAAATENEAAHVVSGMMGLSLSSEKLEGALGFTPEKVEARSLLELQRTVDGLLQEDELAEEQFDAVDQNISLKILSHRFIETLNNLDRKTVTPAVLNSLKNIANSFRDVYNEIIGLVDGVSNPRLINYLKCYMVVAQAKSSQAGLPGELSNKVKAEIQKIVGSHVPFLGSKNEAALLEELGTAEPLPFFHINLRGRQFPAPKERAPDETPRGEVSVACPRLDDRQRSEQCQRVINKAEKIEALLVGITGMNGKLTAPCAGANPAPLDAMDVVQEEGHVHGGDQGLQGEESPGHEPVGRFGLC